MAYVGPLGFTPDRKPEIWQKYIDRLKGNSQWGENIRTNPESVIGQDADILSDNAYLVEELMEGVVHMLDPDTASGELLSQAVRVMGSTRNVAQRSIVELELGSNGYPGELFAGDLVTDENQTVEFELDANVTLPVTGTVTRTATATSGGPITAEPNTLTRIGSPRRGWSTVTNPTAADVGWNKEKDPPLRTRAIRKAQAPGGASIGVIEGNLGNVAGVTDVLVHQNKGTVVDEYGVEPGFIWPIVDGGSDADIAETLYNTVAAPGRYYGSTTVVHTDTDRNNLTDEIKFSHPGEVLIYVVVRVGKQGGYPTNGDALINQYIRDFFAGEFTLNGAVLPKFSLRDNVVASRLYTPANAVPNHIIDAVYIGTAPNPTTSTTIVIRPDQKPVVTEASITVVAV